jgi:hypothetical protein
VGGIGRRLDVEGGDNRFLLEEAVADHGQPLSQLLDLF